MRADHVVQLGVAAKGLKHASMFRKPWHDAKLTMPPVWLQHPPACLSSCCGSAVLTGFPLTAGTLPDCRFAGYDNHGHHDHSHKQPVEVPGFYKLGFA